jgi:integral membrane sensor domain MASE1
MMLQYTLLLSSEVADLVGLRFFYYVVPCHLWGAMRFGQLSRTCAAVVAWVRIEQGKFFMGLADGMKIQVGEIPKVLGE